MVPERGPRRQDTRGVGPERGRQDRTHARQYPAHAQSRVLYADIAGGYADYTNYLFAQSATQTYLNEGLGAYVQFNASPRSSLPRGSRPRTTGPA